MRILFYVEPVSFKLNHRFIAPIMNVIRCIINANKSCDAEFGIMSSRANIEEYRNWLRYGGMISIYCKYIEERDVLSNFDFVINNYAKFIFQSNEFCECMGNAVIDVERDFSPDIIVSFTENRALEYFSKEKLVLFSERGPLPRWNGRDNFYFDPMGHQKNSTLVQKVEDIKAFGITESDALEVFEQFKALHASIPARKDADLAIHDWLESTRDGRKVALIANQPHDSLLVAGVTGGALLEEHMMRTMANLPPDWLAFGTYHPDMGDCSALDSRLTEQFPNYVGLPPALRQFGSDPFADAVDGMITIGSKAALLAALLGRKIVANSRTMLAGLSSSNASDIAEAPILSPIEAGRVLAFLSNRYTVSNECLFEKEGHWRRMLQQMLLAESPGSYLLDPTDWDISKFQRMFGLHGAPSLR